MTPSPEDTLAKMIDNLREKTGKPLTSWLQLIKTREPMKHGEIIKMLKDEFGVTHGYANLIALQVGKAKAPPETGEDAIQALFGGEKAALKSIYDAIIKEISTWGSELVLSPKKQYISLRRKKQFAIIQPSTKTRVDVGIILKGFKPTSRLEPAGSFCGMVTHRVRLESVKEVDKELLRWLKTAYDLA